MNILRWFISFVGTQLLCAVLWFLGPLWPPLEPVLPRAAAIAGAAVVWAIANLALDLRRLSRDRSLAAGVAGGRPADAEAAQLGERLAAAIKTLRASRGRRGALYELPWYVIIGPPGSGKTTALLNAGLQFPLAEQMGRGALAGVGGTRLCDWWFTDQAVLIDTAGRYTTQDSDATVDSAGWRAFLLLLKRNRPKLPLNGVIVAIALADVVGDGSGDKAADRLLHARAISARIAELEDTLGVRLPVYALLTKADLLAGFGEFFGDLDQEAREQVWGLTAPWRSGGKAPGAVGLFAAEFKRWVGALEQRMFARLQGEPNGDRRALLSAFPAQFATVGAPLGEFVEQAFAPGSNGRAPLLRGVYLTSATQEGTPIDRLTGTIARAFGLDGGPARRQRPEDGRSFFLTGLLRDVVFREAMLGSPSFGRRRRRFVLRAAGFAFCLLLLLAGAAALFAGRGDAEAAVARMRDALAGYEEEAATLPLDPVRDADLPALAPLLDRARALADRGDRDRTGAALGLSQRSKLEEAARAVYRHALEHALLPRLLWRLEADLRGNLADPDHEYEATRIYLMLGGAGPLDRALVRQWLQADWAAAYPPELRADLIGHLDALLASPLPRVELDGQVVAAARETFARVSLAQRVYSRLKPQAAALQPWRPSDALGAAGVAVFVRASGKPLTDGVPGLFTPAGLRDVVNPGLEPALAEVAGESWVSGTKTELRPGDPALRAAGAEVLQLYAADYNATWDATLADLDVAPLRSLTQAAQDLYVLASREHSPMRALLASAAAATTLPALPAVDGHFRPLHDLMQPGAIDQVLKPLGDLQQQLAKMAASANRTGAAVDPGSADPVTALQVEALRQPPPLSRWLASVAASGKALRGGGAREQILAAFKAGGGVAALCPQVVKDKYPFAPAAEAEAGLDEFGRLFGPGGVIDAFFNTQLKPYVDTASRPWKLQPVEGVSAPATAADLQQFQRAQVIRDTFFAPGADAPGATSPRLRFDLTPLGADPAGTLATLDTGNASAVAGGGPPRPVQVNWPPRGGAPARLRWAGSSGSGATGSGATGSGAIGPQASGSWALLRLFGQATATPLGPDRTQLTFRDGERSARFEVRMPRDPLSSRALVDFRCPTLQ